jgi:pSer/pThr/pTyr-binding forkhead associated (FHA) protein
LKTGFLMAPLRFCSGCGSGVDEADALFCPACGESLLGGTDQPGLASDTLPRPLTPVPFNVGAPRLQLLNDQGLVEREIPIEGHRIVVGRTDGDLTFSDDDLLSPEHALLTWRENALTVRDLGSANGSWLFITSGHALLDADVLLVGSQIVRFRRVQPVGTGEGDDRSVRAGSRLPIRDNAMLEQLRADGSVRDVLYLSPDRTILIGREHGDWVFPYDPTMSARHAEIRSTPEADEYTVRDLGSRNGVAVLVRGERRVRGGERLLLGRKMLRVDLA